MRNFNFPKLCVCVHARAPQDGAAQLGKPSSVLSRRKSLKPLPNNRFSFGLLKSVVSRGTFNMCLISREIRKCHVCAHMQTNVLLHVGRNMRLLFYSFNGDILCLSLWTAQRSSCFHVSPWARPCFSLCIMPQEHVGLKLKTADRSLPFSHFFPFFSISVKWL